MTLAQDMGLTVEQRNIEVEELATFDEAGACGTAAVISPIEYIYDYDTQKTYTFAKDGKPGKISERLYNRLRAIQYGDEPDKFGWITILD